MKVAGETRTHCPYCALQCGIRISGQVGEVSIAGDTDFPVNRGRLCVKGFTAAVTLRHGDRITSPMARSADGVLEAISWEDAIDRIGAAVERTQREHGRDAVGVFGSGALTNEKAYQLGKFARVGLSTSSIDYNGRFCMSSAAAAANRAFGLDRGLPFPLADVAEAEVVVLAGGNVGDTMPPLMQYLEAQRARGGRLVVVDPRRTVTAEEATLHVSLVPGTDAALVYGLLHVLIRERMVDEAYIAARTDGFERLRALSASYWPNRVERITGVPEGRIVELARLLGRASSVIVLTGRGPEQQSQGVANASAYINLALALGMVGRPNSGYGCLTGQGNGQGGREHGQKADQLPGYRDIRDPEARLRVAGVWRVDEASIPGPGRSAQEMLSTLGEPGGVRTLLVFGANPATSAADSGMIEERLASLDFLIVSDFFLSETAALADVVLPSAQWAEEEGTMTNLEGRVIHRRAATAPPPGVLTDLEILRQLAERLGRGAWFPSSDPQHVFDELRCATAGAPADYSGISYERIDRERGVFWPCPSAKHPGTPRLFTDSFPTADGKARFFVADHRAPAEEPDRDYPLYLSTGRLLAHYQTGNQTRRVETLQQIESRPRAQIHPATARRLGVTDGDEVVLTTRRASGRFPVQVSSSLREDMVFLPFHWGGELSANRLTNAALDPISRMPEFKVCAVRIDGITTAGVNE
ncbi:MAG: molybdopterin-dependent oxidoreductase [Gemmatimonas sp.]|nr:molybdopterin-dependent oxidoreductase [Gemmatimonas sp.]